VRAWLAGCCAETLRVPSRPTKGRCTGLAMRYPAIKKPTKKPQKRAAKTTKAA
jgi:hypothetical protein